MAPSMAQVRNGLLPSNLAPKFNIKKKADTIVRVTLDCQELIFSETAMSLGCLEYLSFCCCLYICTIVSTINGLILNGCYCGSTKPLPFGSPACRNKNKKNILFGAFQSLNTQLFNCWLNVLYFWLYKHAHYLLHSVLKCVFNRLMERNCDKSTLEKVN